MSEPGYPAARAAAAILVRYFERQLRDRPAAATPPPDADAIETIIDAAFWASLRREEGFAPKISLAFLRPEHTRTPLRFERHLTLAPAGLAKLAPAVERPGIHLGVWAEGDELRVWGTTRDVPLFCFVLEVAEPGLLVVKHRRTESGKFVNVLVLQGDSLKVVDEAASNLPDCPSLLLSLLGFRQGRSASDDFDVLVELAVSMRAHGRGGSLLVVPAGSEPWRESILQPVAYAVTPPFNELASLLTARPADGPLHDWHEAVDRAVETIAGLTAVDGATVISDRCELLAFGAKIGRRQGWTRVQELIVTEPIEGSTPETAHPAELGGTRHLSAAQFVQDQRDCLALVASQDGRFTIFAWSPCENMVHAHRVESLLL
jgi:hypothetical protein